MDTDADPATTTEADEDEDEGVEGGGGVSCPLCHDNFRDKATLEEHAMSIHSINAEGLQRLGMLMQGSHWLNKNKNNDDESGR